MRALQDDEFTAIGVFGMGGVGKTSLVKHVGAYARKSGLFDHVIMVVVSQTPNLRNIQGTLADLLGLKLEEETETGRAARLMERIIRGNRILIILDDIWKTIDLSYRASKVQFQDHVHHKEIERLSYHGEPKKPFLSKSYQRKMLGTYL
jgi:disease resistance protein RPS2